MPAIMVPDAFAAMFRNFHQDMFMDHPTMEEVVALMVGSLNAGQKRDALQFLEKLLSGKYSSSEMKGVLNRSMREFGVGRARDVPAFFRAIRDALATIAKA